MDSTVLWKCRHIFLINFWVMNFNAFAFKSTDIEVRLLHSVAAVACLMAYVEITGKGKR